MQNYEEKAIDCVHYRSRFLEKDISSKDANDVVWVWMTDYAIIYEKIETRFYLLAANIPRLLGHTCFVNELHVIEPAHLTSYL